tara:strand:+ start:770 stop:1261 length:492 start_codon:yes stop_codon:yes gene_type:complete
MKKAILLLAILSLIGCKTSKKIATEDKSTQTQLTEKKETTRRGDTVSVFRPVNVKFKDTTIYTYSYDTKSVVREVYDKQGNQQIDCITDEIKELLETTRLLVENNISTNEERKSEFNPAGFIWAIAGLGVVVLLLCVFVMYSMTKLQKAIPNMIAGAVSEVVK